jgi:hypothetical protein
MASEADWAISHIPMTPVLRSWDKLALKLAEPFAGGLTSSVLNSHSNARTVNQSKRANVSWPRGFNLRLILDNDAAV